jgi:carboxyl-terminal processing protease
MPKILLGAMSWMFLATFLQAAENEIAVDSAESRSAGAVYARHLEYTINLIVDEYVRPVSRTDLMFAALSGLYEAAKVPVPSSLRADIEAAKSDSARVALMTEVRQKLGDLEWLRGTAALVASIQAMCKTLDPYTTLLSGEELVRVNQEENNRGSGLEFHKNGGNGPVRIKNVLPGSPAQKAGLRPDDLITQINGLPPDVGFIALGIPQWTRPLRNEPPRDEQPIPSDPVELTVERAGSKIIWKVRLTPAIFRPETVWGVTRKPDNSWDFILDQSKQIAFLRVGSMGEGTAEELQETLAELQAQGIRGLILDLRWNPGGFFNEAVAAARLFMGEELIARIKTRNGTDREYPGKRDVNFLNFPMVVLVNGETSGGAELIAAALQDNQRALVAGQRTLGKASVQSTKALRVPNLGLKLTSGTFVRPSGKNLNRFPDSRRTDDWGVLPNPKLEFRISVDAARQLREWYLWQTLRPGGSIEALPLDDPVADPQRYAAWMALTEKIK